MTAPVWKRGAESAEIVSPVHQSLAITALGWSGATPKDGVNAEVIEVDSLEALSKLPKGSAKGKIIFGNVVMKKSIDGKGYGDAVPMRLAGPKAAMDAGAVAFVLRTVGTAEDRFPHAGSSLLREVAKPIAAGALSTTDAELLHATLTKHPDLKLKVILTPERAKDAATSNVVGEIPGTTKKTRSFCWARIWILGIWDAAPSTTQQVAASFSKPRDWPASTRRPTESRAPRERFASCSLPLKRTRVPEEKLMQRNTLPRSQNICWPWKRT